MIDVISGGRVISGMVRGTGVETVSTNMNPVENRDRFEECHDLVIKTWTTPGPFRWEGKHFNYRAVNPWMVPIQKPHPPVWVPAPQPRDRPVGRAPRLHLCGLPDGRGCHRGAVRDVP